MYTPRLVLLTMVGLVSLGSHSRPEEVPVSRRRRMLQRPSHEFKTGLQKQELRFLSCPTRLRKTQGRSAHAAKLRRDIKHCQASSRLLQLLDNAICEGKMEASVIGAAMQTCGYNGWWDTFVEVRAIQQEQDVAVDALLRNIAMTALAHCLKRDGRRGVLAERKQAVLLMAQNIWQEVAAPKDPYDFNCGLSSTLKLARCIDSPEALAWAHHVWRNADVAIRKSSITYSTYVHFLEHCMLHKDVDAMLAKDQVNLNCVLLGALLDCSASRGDVERAEHVWRVFVDRHGVRPNLLCYCAFGKAFLVAGRPTSVVQLLRPLADEACDKGNFNLLSDYAQSLLILCHSSLEAQHLQHLQQLLEKCTPPPTYRSRWRLYLQAARVLAAGRRLRLHDVLIEWKARTLGRMANWENFSAGSDYLARMEAGEESGQISLERGSGSVGANCLLKLLVRIQGNFWG